MFRDTPYKVVVVKLQKLQICVWQLQNIAYFNIMLVLMQVLVVLGYVLEPKHAYNTCGLFSLDFKYKDPHFGVVLSYLWPPIQEKCENVLI